MLDSLSLLVLSFQGAILGLLVVSVRRGNAAAAVNALGALVLAVLPTVIEIVFPSLLGQTVTLDRLTLWLAVAGLLHTLGMLGLYESIWWWDHLTHTLSAALVAALLYASIIVALPGSAGWPGVAGALTVVFTFGIGVFWELVELVAREVGERYDIEPVLVHYGWRDTALDLVFNVVGAVVVVVFDLRVFVSVVEQVPAVVDVLLASGVTVLLGSIAMTLFVVVGPIRS